MYHKIFKISECFFYKKIQVISYNFFSEIIFYSAVKYQFHKLTIKYLLLTNTIHRINNLKVVYSVGGIQVLVS